MNATTIVHNNTCLLKFTWSIDYRAKSSSFDVIVMRQGRGSEATEAVFCLQAKSLFIVGRTSMRRVPKIKNKNIFLYQGCLIQHRNWPLRSTILDAHGTNASPRFLPSG